MSGPSKWQMPQGQGLTVPSLIAKSCGGDPRFGLELAPSGDCCAKACGCWCIGIVSYNKTQGYSSYSPLGPLQPQDSCSGYPEVNLCRVAPSLAAYHLSSKGTYGPTDPRDWYCGGDVITSLYAGDNFSGGGPALTITLGPTIGWVLYYDDANWRAYVNIKFQNAPQGSPLSACCNTSTPCYEAIDVPHLHPCTTFPDGITCADGTVCVTDDWNAGRTCLGGCSVYDECGYPVGSVCQDWGGSDFEGCDVPSGCQICGNIVESPFVPGGWDPTTGAFVPGSTTDISC